MANIFQPRYIILFVLVIAAFMYYQQRILLSQFNTMNAIVRRFLASQQQQQQQYQQPQPQPHIPLRRNDAVLLPANGANGANGVNGGQEEVQTSTQTNMANVAQVCEDDPWNIDESSNIEARYASK